MRVEDRGEAKGSGGSGLFWRLLWSVLLVVVVSLVIAYWPWISAQVRAVVVLSSVIETPVLTPAVEGLTGEPRVEDRAVAGVPTLVARPGGEGPWPALVFANGAVPPGRREPEVGRLARGLARAGYLVYVPDVSGLRSGEISDRTVSETVGVARAAADGPDAKDGRVGFVGVSVGASLALLAAEDKDLADRVSVVSVVAPYADLENVLGIATTGVYRGGEKPARYATPDYLRLVAARSLAALLPPGEGREALLALIPQIKYYYPDDGSHPDPLLALPAFRVVGRDGLGPGARGVLDLLVSEDPRRFDRLYAGLPARMRAEIERLSPITRAERLRAPVEIVSAPRDKYFPLAESRAIVRRAPEARLTVTPALSHANPAPSLRDLPAFVRLDGFIVRSLREASRDLDGDR